MICVYEEGHFNLTVEEFDAVAHRARLAGRTTGAQLIAEGVQPYYSKQDPFIKNSHLTDKRK